MRITYFGTTMLLFDDGRDQLLFDAHLTRPSLLRFLLGRVRTDRALVEELLTRHRVDRLRGIFISHTHTDHVLDMPCIAERCGCEVYGSPSAMNVARGGAVPEHRLHCFADAMEYTIGDFHVSVLPSLHSKPTAFNNDLGQPITRPLAQPAPARRYKEGGSYDFLVRHGDRRYLIRPSFNYIPGQLDGIRADVLFLGIAGLSKADEAMKARFFAETIERVQPSLVIPLHWDNFFTPLEQHRYGMLPIVEHTDAAMYELVRYCAEHSIDTVVQLPMTALTL